MARNVNHFFVSMTALLGVATVTVAIAAPPDSDVADVSKTPPPAPTLLPRGPITVYDNSCARCHGPNGSFYGPTLGQGKTDEELRKVIHEMADGPGNETFTPAELEGQTAYHRAIIRKEPFVVVTVRKDDRIEGEVTPGATVSVRRKAAKEGDTAPSAEVAAKVEGSHWTLTLPNTGSEPLIVIARQDKVDPNKTDPNKTDQDKAKIDKVEVSIDTSQQLWSHTQPLIVPKKDGTASG